jgi:RHS repeat-associated protein
MIDMRGKMRVQSKSGGLGRIAQVAADDTTHYYLSDGLGSTIALTDADGDGVNTYDYDVFGAVRSSTGSQPNEFRFTGEQWDDSAGLEYLRARYYDPAVGRFLGRDPFGGLMILPQSLNRYAYVLNNPALYRDPYGYWPSLGDVWDKTKDVAGAAADFVTDPDNIVSGVQMVSGVVMVGTCSGGVAPVCVVSAGVYTGASVAKILMADNLPEQIVVGGTAVLGYANIPLGGVWGVVIAGLSDLAEDLVANPGVAYAPGYNGSGVGRSVSAVGHKKE